MTGRLLVTALAAALIACEPPPEGLPSTEVAPREEGWLRGDLHQHTEHSDGDDTTGTVIRIAESLTSELFLEAHPEYEGNGLDFMAITDHRTVAILEDPELTSDQLILIPGEEFGSNGHANIWGMSRLVDHDPDDDGVSLEDIRAGAADATEQGALFSVNHPFLQGIPFPWDLRDHHALEVWNSGWSLMGGALSAEEVEAWEAEHGPASPMFRRAAQVRGGGNAVQALIWYEAQLSRGIHLALVGGSDRHTLLMMGFPTTWVRAESETVDGVLEGIRDRHTFVARTPVSARVELEVEVDGERYIMGDQVPLPESGEAQLTVRVGRSDGAMVRLIAGEAVASDEDLSGAPLGQVIFEAEVEGDSFTAETPLAVTPGSWVYPVVLEPLVAPGLTEEQAVQVREVAAGALETGGEDFARLAGIAIELADVGAALGTDPCEPEEWSDDLFQCLPADDDNMGTFFIPDHLDRAFNVYAEDGQMTDWCMGAVGSALLFTDS